MRYIGIDLAWGQKNTTAAVVLEGPDDPAGGATLAHVADALTNDDAIVAFVATHGGEGGVLVGIDAPTLVPNLTGRRPCEAILSRCMARAQAGPHPANRTLLAAPDGTIRGERLVARLAAEQGIAHTPYLADLPAPPRAAFEVFPHPAHVALWELDKTLKYKAKPGRPLADRRDVFRRYAALLAGLGEADPPLHLTGAAGDWVRRDPATFALAADLKRHEDALDALTCAYITLYHYRWGEARTVVLGDLTGGYIVTPATDAMRECFARTAADLAVG